jgi:hypothetical protein
MGNFLEAFYHTGFYYPFVGIMQVLAAVLLLIPRTVTLGAFIYVPIILNICILSIATRFDGSQVTSPLMVFAVLYILCWNYHKFRDIFPFNHKRSKEKVPQKNERTNRFPFGFFAGVFAVVIAVFLHATVLYDIMPRNTLSDCKNQCMDKSQACLEFCECIHLEGNPLTDCLEKFELGK